VLIEELVVMSNRHPDQFRDLTERIGKLRLERRADQEELDQILSEYLARCGAH
jgi:hypothetical protein